MKKSIYLLVALAAMFFMSNSASAQTQNYYIDVDYVSSYTGPITFTISYQGKVISTKTVSVKAGTSGLGIAVRTSQNERDFGNFDVVLSNSSNSRLASYFVILNSINNKVVLEANIKNLNNITFKDITSIGGNGGGGGGDDTSIGGR